MESRFRILFLVLPLFAFGLSGCAATKNLFGMGQERTAPPSAEDPGQVIEPEVERREIKEPEIDTEDFEIGLFGGIMSIEDFGRRVCTAFGLPITSPKAFSSRARPVSPRRASRASSG